MADPSPDSDRRFPLLRALPSAHPVPTIAEPTIAWPTIAWPTIAWPTIAGPTIAGPTIAGPTIAGPTALGLTATAPTPVEALLPVRNPPRLALTVLDEAARVPGLAALLRDVDNLRQSLRTDLSLAATAAAAGEPELAAFVLHGPDLGTSTTLAVFEQRALAHLTGLELAESGAPVDQRHNAPALNEHNAPALNEHSAPTPGGHSAPTPRTRIRRRRLLPAAPILAAAALFGVLVGLNPHTSRTGSTGADTTATAALARVSQLAFGDAPAAELSAAAAALHASLLPLVAQAAANPQAAAQALSILQVETDILQRSSNPGLLLDVIDQAQVLVRQLLAALPSRLPAGVTVQPVRTPDPAPATRPPSPSPAPPSPAPRTSPSASPTRTSPAPSSPATKRPASPAPAASSPSPGVVPEAPHV